MDLTFCQWFAIGFAATALGYGLVLCGIEAWKRHTKSAGQWTVEMWAEHYGLPLDVARGTIPKEYLAEDESEGR